MRTVEISLTDIDYKRFIEKSQKNNRGIGEEVSCFVLHALFEDELIGLGYARLVYEKPLHKCLSNFNERDARMREEAHEKLRELLRGAWTP